MQGPAEVALSVRLQAAGLLQRGGGRRALRSPGAGPPRPERRQGGQPSRRLPRGQVQNIGITPENLLPTQMLKIMV